MAHAAHCLLYIPTRDGHLEIFGFGFWILDFKKSWIWIEFLGFIQKNPKTQIQIQIKKKIQGDPSWILPRPSLIPTANIYHPAVALFFDVHLLFIFIDANYVHRQKYDEDSSIEIHWYAEMNSKGCYILKDNVDNEIFISQAEAIASK